MFKWFPGLIDRICAVIGAITFAQFPAFMQQYTQQLIGRTAEIQLQVAAMRRSAALSSKTLEQLTKKFLENADSEIARQGEIMAGIATRGQQLSDALTAMQDSTVWTRPFAFLSHLNGDIFVSTFQGFTIGIPLNVEAGVYALIGILVGYLFFALCKLISKKGRTVLLPNSPQSH